MNILVIEDEKLAAQKLIKVLNKLLPDASITGNLETIEESVEYLRNEQPDLIFLDIELSDGISFEIFKRVTVSSPIIFTTAYNQYAIQAFEVNSIAYLLKPIAELAVKSAVDQYESMRGAFNNTNIAEVLKTLDLNRKSYQSSFLVKSGTKLIPIEVEQIAYFFASDKWTYLITRDNNKYMIDFTLNKLEDLLDPKMFLRVNRSYICQKNSIDSLDLYHNSQVLVQIKPSPKEMIIVSRNKTPILKNWLIDG